MTKDAYMTELKKYLKRLSKEDYENAIEYFEEYFDEAGPENEQSVMDELGSPKEAAKELLVNLLEENMTASDKKPSIGKVLGISFLVLCASPIAIPLIITLAALLLCVLLTIASLFVVSGSLVISGILCAIKGISLIVTTWAGCSAYVGAGFFLGGLGLVTLVLEIYLVYWIFIGVGHLAHRLARKECV